MTSASSAKHPGVQHLVAADEHSLAELEALLATLPVCATGRVFVEVPDAGWISRVEAPPRMVVSWLDRSVRSGAPGTGRACSAGAALRRAATAWADEMLVDGADGTHVTLLCGYLATADIVEHLTERLHVPATAIHTPERFSHLTAGH